LNPGHDIYGIECEEQRLTRGRWKRKNACLAGINSNSSLQKIPENACFRLVNSSEHQVWKRKTAV